MNPLNLMCYISVGQPAQLYDELNPDWAPSLQLGWELIQPESSSRYERNQQRRDKRRRLEACEGLSEVSAVAWPAGMGREAEARA